MKQTVVNHTAIGGFSEKNSLFAQPILCQVIVRRCKQAKSAGLQQFPCCMNIRIKALTKNVHTVKGIGANHILQNVCVIHPDPHLFSGLLLH